MAESPTVEFVHAVWSAPSHVALRDLEDALSTPEFAHINLVTLDHDTLEPTSQLQARGECRVDGGPWTTVEAGVAELRAAAAKAEPVPDLDETLERFAERAGVSPDDPDAFGKLVSKATTDPAVLEAIGREGMKAAHFMAGVVNAIGQMPSHLRLHYRGELMAIAKDLAHDLGFEEIDDEKRKILLQGFLQFGDDDDDDDEEKPAVPPGPGELVSA